MHVLTLELREHTCVVNPLPSWWLTDTRAARDAGNTTLNSMPMPKVYEQNKKGEVADAKAVPAKNDKENKKGGKNGNKKLRR